MAGYRWWPTWRWAGNPPARDFEPRPWSGEEFAPAGWRILPSSGDGRLYMRFMIAIEGMVHAGPAIDILDVAEAGFNAEGIARALEGIVPEAQRLSGDALRRGTTPRDRLSANALWPNIDDIFLLSAPLVQDDYRGDFTALDAGDTAMRDPSTWQDGTGIRTLRVSPVGWTGPELNADLRDESWKWSRVVAGSIVRLRLPGTMAGGAHFWVVSVADGGEGNLAYREFTLSHLQGQIAYSPSDSFQFSALCLPGWITANLIDGLVDHGQLDIGAVQPFSQVSRTTDLLISEGGKLLRLEVQTLDGLVRPDQMTRIDLTGYAWKAGGSVLNAGELMPATANSLSVANGFELRGASAHIAQVLRFTTAGFWFQLQTGAGAVVTEGLVLAINILDMAAGLVQFSLTRQNIDVASLAADTALRLHFSGSGARHDEFTQTLGASKTRGPSEHAVLEALGHAGTTLPASAPDGYAFTLTAADGSNPAGRYDRRSGSWVRLADAA